MSPARLWPLSALFLFLAVVRPADAARYLEFTVEVDGQTVLIGPSGDNGRQTPAEVWRRWSDVRLEVQDTAVIAAQPANSTSCTLHGNIVLQVRHSSSILGAARVEQLALVRETSQSATWSLPESEVARTASAAGLPPVTARSTQTVISRLVQVVAAGLLFCLVLAAVAVIRRSRRSPELSAAVVDS